MDLDELIVNGSAIFIRKAFDIDFLGDHISLALFKDFFSISFSCFRSLRLMGPLSLRLGLL